LSADEVVCAESDEKKKHSSQIMCKERIRYKMRVH
jgi:hypothetical protein